MHSFLVLTGGLLLAAASIFAVPLTDDVFARAVEHVKFGGSVNPEHHASIHEALQAHHDALPHDHAAKGATSAKVMGTGWHTSDDDPREHATVSYFRAGAQNSRNHLATHHVLKPRAYDIFARGVEHVKFGGSVNPEHHASIHTALQAHHDALPAGHAAKGAASAKVMGTGWHTTEDDPQEHATVSFFKSGAQNSRNHLATHHVYKPRAYDIFARGVEHVKFGGSVNPEHHASIHTALQAHHDALPADHAAKGAASAKVMGTGWHTSEDDQHEHATVSFFRPGAQNSRNHLATHHVYRN